MDTRAQSRFSASNVPYVLLGTGMLWFGWYGFNAGSAPPCSCTCQAPPHQKAPLEP